MPTIPPTVRRRVRRAGTAAAANIRSAPARQACLRERTAVRNIIRRPATRSARRLMRITAETALQFPAHMAALHISATVRQSVKAAILTTVETERRSALLTAVNRILPIVQVNVRLDTPLAK